MGGDEFFLRWVPPLPPRSLWDLSRKSRGLRRSPEKTRRSEERAHNGSTYMHALKKNQMCRNIWANGAGPSVLRSEKCAALHFPLYKPPVAFERPNPRRNVYRSVLKTTPLTPKTAAIGSGRCQNGEKAQSHHFSFPFSFFFFFFFLLFSPFSQHVLFLENRSQTARKSL